KVQLSTLGRLVPALFQSTPQSDAVLESSDISGRALKLAKRWARDDEWRTCLEHYLETLCMLASRQVPLDPIAPFVLPGFACMYDRASEEGRKRFLSEVVKWIPSANGVATEQTTI